MGWFEKDNKLSPVREEELKVLAKLITQEMKADTKDLIDRLHFEVNQRFREVQAQLQIMDSNLELLEKKINIKELSDRQSYGQLHYKIEELNTIKNSYVNKTKNLKDIKDEDF